MELLKPKMLKRQNLKKCVQKKFSKVVSNKGQYKAFLKESMIQAFLLIWDEDEVQVSCRSEDAAVVKDLIGPALQDAKTKAEKASGQKLAMKATFNQRPIKCSGGVLISARGGNIICDNTLDARLKIVMREQLPMVRSRLFGKGRLTSDS